MPIEISKQRRGGDVASIFLHAGAGYHSKQNERVHLTALADAAKAAMVFIKNGGTALDAVEVAIRVLEDKEITNAGYGSNLAMNGTVECDATVVDHYGRSGAVGAVGQISNPIHLARLVLEATTKPLSLRRVPPNLLVGEGATEFAFQSGVPVLPHDSLISRGAKERWERWKADLDSADQEGDSESGTRPGSPTLSRDDLSKSPLSESVLMAGLVNESQPYSPHLTAADSVDIEDLESLVAEPALSEQHDVDADISVGNAACKDSDVSSRDLRAESLTQHGNDGQSSQQINGRTGIVEDDSDYMDTDNDWERDVLEIPVSYEAGSRVDDESMKSFSDMSPTSIHSSSPRQPHQALEEEPERDDDVTDTVGAIAIDLLGNIAAGSSSGGIGMKHKGRVGPAALVGVGTAIIPKEPEDKSETSVATVTSGTGEHMATTMAAATCAERLYHNHKRGKDGTNLRTTEEGAIRNFVAKDFMSIRPDHPSVKKSLSAAAIGVMAVKTTVDGIYLHFVHNTDSFAVASMHDDEPEPSLVMSRSKGHGSITSGARAIKFKPTSAQSRAASDSKSLRPRKLDRWLAKGSALASSTPAAAASAKSDVDGKHGYLFGVPQHG